MRSDVQRLQSSSNSRYLMNDIPRGTPRTQLINYLMAPNHWPDTPRSNLGRDVFCSIAITNSRLDDELSVAVIEFSKTPEWLHRLNQDPCGFPKRVPLGTLWRGIDANMADERGQTPFMRGVIKGGLSLLDVEMMAEFEDTDVNIQDLMGRTALHWACAGNHSDMVRLCLSVPECQIGLLDNDGFTAFDLSMGGAGVNGNEMIPNLFYKNILDIEETHPQTALLRSLTVTSVPAVDRPTFPGAAMFDPIKTNNVHLVAALLRRGVDLTATNGDGDTALHVAAKMGNQKIASMLLKAGSKANDTGSGGATAFDHAIIIADKEMIELFLDWEAGIVGEEADETQKLSEARDYQLQIPPDAEKDFGGHSLGGQSALQVEASNPAEGRVVHVDQEKDSVINQDVLVRAFLKTIEFKNESGMTALARAASAGDLSTVQVLLELGANMEASDKNGYTALLFAAENGQTEMVTILLSAGASITALRNRLVPFPPCDPGKGPLHLAAANGHAETVKALLARGSKSDSTATHLRNTALHEAATNGHMDTVEILLADCGGVNIGAMNSEGETALALAAGSGHTETVEALLFGGADVEGIARVGHAPLILAAQGGHSETVKTLLTHGARVNVWSGEALKRAAAGGHMEVVKALRDGGAQIEARHTREFSEIDRAVIDGHVELVRLLLGCLPKTKGADEIRDSALSIAIDRGRMDIVGLLLADGARRPAARFRHSVLSRLGVQDKTR
ncbi:hypothetical protein Q9L58_004078 [Maublancomyces gigas]|uniref:Uncharacterized protein n=1 Tax=Discina gigas TaxID=1032678 RepID=A0ABR3GM29_9PEZI